MKNKEFKYDVAFSFLAEDEELAIQISDHLQDRLITFIYSERQKELAGKDGEKKFNQVIGRETRIVFVIYRDKWGKTPWTKIEETAIRNRAFNESYDFVIFGCPEKTSKLPEYLPKTQIWVDLERYGIEGAASVIEARVKEFGGTPRQETIEERAARLSRAIDFEKEKKEIINSEKGVKYADEEMKNIFSEVEIMIEKINKNKSNLELEIQRNGHVCLIYGGGHKLQLLWHSRYVNTIKDARFYLPIWKGWVTPPKERWLPPLEEPIELESRVFKFDINKANIKGWREESKKNRFFTSKQFAEESLKVLFKSISGEVEEF